MKNLSIILIGISILYIACKSGGNRQSKDDSMKANGTDTTITFDGSEVSKLPTGWSAETGEWKIAGDAANAALKMERNMGSSFNIAVLGQKYYEDLSIEARIKAIQGDEDRGGGLVWRYVDKDNYYIIRANPLENNIRLYMVVSGKRKQLESKDISMNTGDWFSIKVVTKGNRIECYYNSNKVFDTTDKTFTNAGLVGFWSKADAVSLFDDMNISNLTPISSNNLGLMKPETKKVIFVCEHGAGKSVVAAAYFNKIAQDRNLPWEATCRGTDPDEQVSAPTQEGLRSDGLLLPTLAPQKLSPGDTTNVERVILFTKLPDDFKTTIQNEDWSSLPNIDGKYEVRRDALIKKINQFFDSIEKQK